MEALKSTATSMGGRVAKLNEQVATGKKINRPSDEPGRISQLHLKDLKKGTKLPNFGRLSNDAFKELGEGSIRMEPIIKAAGKSGVAHCHVEQDHSPDPLASIHQSMEHLKAL